MLTGQTYNDAVYGFWAKRFACQQTDFFTPCTWVRQEEELHGTGKCVLYHIEKACVIRIDPALAELINLSGGMFPRPAALTLTDLQDLAGSRQTISLTSTLLDHFVDPADFKSFPVPAGFSVRYLDDEEDHNTLMGFYDQCSPEDLDEAMIYLDEPDPVILGLFDDEQMAAYASHRYWGDILADIGVLVHKDYRQRGLGKAAVSELCQWCFDHDIVPMYRAMDYNTGSLRIPHALGFERLLTIESLIISQVIY